MHHTQLISPVLILTRKRVTSSLGGFWPAMLRAGSWTQEIFLILVGPPVPSLSPEHVTSPPAFDGIMGRGSDGRWDGVTDGRWGGEGE